VSLVKSQERCNVIKRLTEELDFRLNHKINKVINIGEITVRSALTDYTFSVSETVLNKQAELISDINALPDVFIPHPEEMKSI
jgi:hypothetical protein